MNEAETIMAGMKAMAKGQANDDETSEIEWCGIICRYYPRSNRVSWFHDGTNITSSLKREQVISLINNELQECARMRA